jgi:sulfur relay (sulfurtransferase) complex TusBCD TusD component (DsrE family)
MSKQRFKQVQVYLFNKSQQMRYLNQQAAHLCYAAIGERGVMKTKVIGIALVFGLLAGGLGACNQTGGEGASPSPAESPTTSPTTSP